MRISSPTLSRSRRQFGPRRQLPSFGLAAAFRLSICADGRVYPKSDLRSAAFSSRYLNRSNPVSFPMYWGYLTPSCVGLLDDGRIVVGDSARELAVLPPDKCAATFKRAMGTDQSIAPGEKSFTAPQLSSLILASLKQDTERELGHPVTQTVVTRRREFYHRAVSLRPRRERAGVRIRGDAAPLFAWLACSPKPKKPSARSTTNPASRCDCPHPTATSTRPRLLPFRAPTGRRGWRRWSRACGIRCSKCCATPASPLTTSGDHPRWRRQADVFHPQSTEGAFRCSRWSSPSTRSSCGTCGR